jgi:hypothetical protein
MPVLDIDPGQSPEAPGTLSFFEQGRDPSTGFQVSSEGEITSVTVTSLALVGDEDTTDVLTARVDDDDEPQFVLNANGRLEFGGGDDPPDVSLFRDGSVRLHTTNTFVTEGDLVCDSAGGGLFVREGANCRSGVATLVAGAATVATTEVTATSRIQVTSQADGGTPGWLRVSARVAGTSFTVTSSSGTDTSTVAWFIVEPAA